MRMKRLLRLTTEDRLKARRVREAEYPKAISIVRKISRVTEEVW